MDKDQIIKLAVEAVREYDEKNRKSRHDRRLRNTRLLLKNYLLLREHCEKAVYEKQNPLEDDNAIDVLDTIEAYDHETYIKAIKSSVTRTKIILAHIDEMMKIYKILCDTSPRPEDKRRYRILCATFFHDEEMNVICKNENVDKSTFYRDIREGVEKLSALFFGIDGLLDVRK
jgi:hypothetical protein